MGECVEKIYCCDRGDNDNVLAAAILANNNNNNRYGYGDFDMNGWMNNPFAYLMFLALFRNGGFGFVDGNGTGVATQGIETQAQLNAICTQLQDNTQRIIDTLNNHWKDEQALKIQDLKFELSQERQNNYFARLINSGCGCGGNSRGCGCGQ
jgi:hypothetical protein